MQYSTSHQALMKLFVAGATAKVASQQAGVSYRTARRFRKANWDEIQRLQHKATINAAESLAEIVPAAIARLSAIVNDTEASRKDILSAIKICLDSYKIFKDSDLEKRLKLLEKMVEEQTAELDGPTELDERN